MRYHLRGAEIQGGVPELAASSPLGGDNWDKWLGGWTADSRAVVFVSSPQGKFGIFKQPVRTQETQTLVSGPDSYGSPVATPEGQWLLFTQLSQGDNTGVSARLMRISMNGGPTTLLAKGRFSYECAVQAHVCVLSEVTKDKRVFSLLDPLKGRGSDLAQTAATSDGWSLSFDGKRIALLPKDQADQIQIISTTDGKTNSIELKDWQLQSISWAPDNQHLFASGFSPSAFSIRLVNLDGKFRELFEVPGGQG